MKAKKLNRVESKWLGDILVDQIKTITTSRTNPFGVKPVDILEKRRNKKGEEVPVRSHPVLFLRQMAQVIMYNELRGLETGPTIASFFDQDHATVTHSFKLHDEVYMNPDSGFEFHDWYSAVFEMLSQQAVTIYRKALINQGLDSFEMEAIPKEDMNIIEEQKLIIANLEKHNAKLTDHDIKRNSLLFEAKLKIKELEDREKIYKAKLKEDSMLIKDMKREFRELESSQQIN